MTPFALGNPDYHLLLPVLLFCADDHRRLLVPGTDAAVVRRLRHQAPDDIPAFVPRIDACAPMVVLNKLNLLLLVDRAPLFGIGWLEGIVVLH